MYNSKLKIFNFIFFIFMSTSLVTKAESNNSPDLVRYNEVCQKSSHNSEQKNETLDDQVGYHQIHSIELDLHEQWWGYVPTQGDWFIYHSIVDRNMSSLLRLSDALMFLANYHYNHPEHEVITVFLDMKDSFNINTPDALDSLIEKYIPANTLYTPNHMLRECGCTNIKDLQVSLSTGNCHWPFLSALRGKFIFVLTDATHGSQCGDYGSESSIVYQYLDYFDPQVANGKVFIGPAIDLNDYNDILLCISEWKQAVFFNSANAGCDYNIIRAIKDRGLVSRVWGINSLQSWTTSVNFGVNHIATDKINYIEDSWARTHSQTGYPFQCIDPIKCNTNFWPGPKNLLTAKVDSGDIANTLDSFGYAYNIYKDRAVYEWKAVVYAPSSHVDKWGKACLMARAEPTPGAQYFAVCRTADVNVARIQMRRETGETSSAIDFQDVIHPENMNDYKLYNFDSDPEWDTDQEALTFLYLMIKPQGDGDIAYGYIGTTNSQLKLIGYQYFPLPLKLQGIAVSSHSSGTIKYLFRRVTHCSNGCKYMQSDDFAYKVGFHDTESFILSNGYTD